MARWILAAAIVGAVAACGGAGEDGGADGARLAAFRAGVERVDAAAAAYGSSAANAADAGACLALHHGYDADVRPVVDHLREMAGWMDERVAARCDPAHADVSCGADAMCAELDRHASAACAAADMGANAAEAAAHAAAMHDWAEHQRTRAGELEGAMAGRGAHHMGDGPGTFTCTP